MAALLPQEQSWQRASGTRNLKYLLSPLREMFASPCFEGNLLFLYLLTGKWHASECPFYNRVGNQNLQPRGVPGDWHQPWHPDILQWLQRHKNQHQWEAAEQSVWPLWQLQWGLNRWLRDLAGEAGGEQRGAGSELENQWHAEEVRAQATGCSGPSPPMSLTGVDEEGTLPSVTLPLLQRAGLKVFGVFIIQVGVVISWLAEKGAGLRWSESKFFCHPGWCSPGLALWSLGKLPCWDWAPLQGVGLRVDPGKEDCPLLLRAGTVCLWLLPEAWLCRWKLVGIKEAIFFFSRVHGMRKFPGQGLNLCHSSNPSHSSDNARPLTC